jgi:predicted nucleic acid-binding protein
LLVDTSVARNFAIAGWIDQLSSLGDDVIQLAQGVLGVDAGEPGELDRAKAFFERQTRTNPNGSPEYTRGLLAAMRLDELISRRDEDLEVVVPTPAELDVAIRLQDPDQRAWRQGMGMRARRLDAGEAVSVAIAVSRDDGLGCDEEDGGVAYAALGGVECLSTLDLVRRAVERGLLSESEAQEGYETLRTAYRFFAPGWRE